MIETDDQQPSLLRNDGVGNRQLAAEVAQVDDPKSVALRSDAPGEKAQQMQQWLPADEASRERCQVVYIMGVEGATHHGFIPIIESLAKAQRDENGVQYHVTDNPKDLKAGLFGWYGRNRIQEWGFKKKEPMNNPEFVKRVVEESCPDDGKKHVLIEWASFPSGQEDDHRSYRVKRQHKWLSMTPEEIAVSDEALNHPSNMTDFVHAYSPLVDIKFVVLHRPFLETIASHHGWDGGAEIHSNVIRGFMLLLRKFLDDNPSDLVTGKRLWNLLCVERIVAKNYDNKEDVVAARSNVVANLAEFLGWPNGECPTCFDSWHDSKKDPRTVLGKDKVDMLMEHMKLLEGVWPPPGVEGVVEQQCGV